MAPKNKTIKPNGFFVFMQEMKPRLESDGHRFPNGFPDVHPICTPMWNNMTTEQKEAYNNIAKGMPKGQRKVEVEKYDTRGVPLSWKAREEEQAKKAKKEEFESIENMISHFHQRGVLVTHFFHLAHFNYAVATDEQEFPPCEVAIVKYSLANGIVDEYHQFVNPGKLRLGYSFAAKQHADETHRIPSGFEKGNANYIEITDALKKIIRQSDGNLAPIFFLESEIPKAKWILEWFVDKSIGLDPNYDSINPFRPYSLNKLFYELRRHANLEDRRLQFASNVMVAEKLCSGGFDFCPNMACKWHEEEDRTKYCSQSTVRNYAYIISDMCCEHYGLRLLPNRHCPASIADESKYEIKPPTEPRKPDDEVSVTSEVDSSIGSAPRMPRGFGNVVGSRLAPGFGMGRGLLASSSVTSANTRTPQESLSSALSSPIGSASPSPSLGAGRGRGRGLLGE